MISTISRRQPTRVGVYFLLLALATGPGLDASPISKVLITGGKLVVRSAGKEVIEEGAEKLAKEQLEGLAVRYGDDALRRLRSFGETNAVDEQRLLKLAAEHGDVLARHHGFADEAVAFALRHKGSGIFFLRHPELFNALKSSGRPLSELDSKVIAQAWRWGDDKAIGGSLTRLRDSLTQTGLTSGRTRDFCEDLFKIRAAQGRIRGIPKGSDLIKAQLGESRNGIDFILPENGRVRVIEFGTGKKPIADELSWNRIRHNLATFVEQQSVDSRINLRQAGFPQEILVNPSRIRSPEFPIEKYVSREIYAPEMNVAELRRTGPDVVAILLP